MKVNKSDVEFLQDLRELELCELILIPLLDKMGYSNIRYTHGIFEKGKDIIFSKTDAIYGEEYYAATVKSKKLSGSVSSSKSIWEVYFQINQALKSPFIDPFDGNEVILERVFFITPYEISQQSVESIKEELHQLSNRLYFVDIQKLLTLINKYDPMLLNSKPDPVHRYLHTLCQRFIHNPTLSKLKGAKNHSILNIYTGGNIARTTPDEARYISFVLPSLSKSGKTMMETFPESPFSIILADVGAGKTTLLQKFALDITNHSEQNVKNNSQFIPLFIPLSMLPVKKIQSFQLFLNSIEEYIQKIEGFNEFSLSDQKDYILLLDGFDELSERHGEIASYVARLYSKFPKGIIITSRPSRIPNLPSPFQYYYVISFNDEDIWVFLEKWFKEDNVDYQKIYNRIMGSKELKLFCRTPLMLTLYAILGQRYTAEQLPTRKTEIYQLIVKMLLGDWDVIRNVKNYFDVEEKKFVLERLAFQIHSANSKKFHVHRLSTIIKNILDACKNDLSSDLMFGELIFRSSLLKKVGESHLNPQFEFVHLSFQEFFAASYLNRMQDMSTVQKYLYNNWWKNTILFYFGLRRNMDDFRFSKKRAGGEGLRLMEFLSEANFTGQIMKKKIFEIVAKDLLYSHITQNDLEICASLGDEIISILTPIVENKSFRGNIYNYFRILLSINSENSRTVFSNLIDGEYHVNIIELSNIIYYACGYFETKVEELELFDKILGRIEKRVEESSTISRASLTIDNLRKLKNKIKVHFSDTIFAKEEKRLYARVEQIEWKIQELRYSIDDP
jgi:hypothetical protein